MKSAGVRICNRSVFNRLMVSIRKAYPNGLPNTLILFLPSPL
ncbi:hypothetical protein B4125_3559 [Bacillus paralicheniformis]|nr:hypothetical protein B4125_3559 [Bacillus paralicheniformis]TWN66273.1 hypothetical protein CHCC12620_2678 [Bacillus paralicheniformis]